MKVILALLLLGSDWSDVLVVRCISLRECLFYNGDFDETSEGGREVEASLCLRVFLR